MNVQISPHLLLTLISSYFDHSHPSGCEVAFHCGFEIHFPIVSVTENPPNFSLALPAAPSWSHC